MDVESLETRCPRLGGPVQFSYCRICGESANACFKILDCWWEHFDVFAYLKARLSSEDFMALRSGNPKPKIDSLMAQIEKAKRTVTSSTD